MIKTLEFETINKNGLGVYQGKMKVNINKNGITKNRYTDLLSWYSFKELNKDVEIEEDISLREILIHMCEMDVNLTYYSISLKSDKDYIINNDILLRLSLN